MLDDIDVHADGMLVGPVRQNDEAQFGELGATATHRTHGDEGYLAPNEAIHRTEGQSLP